MHLRTQCVKNATIVFLAPPAGNASPNAMDLHMLIERLPLRVTFLRMISSTQQLSLVAELLETRSFALDWMKWSWWDVTQLGKERAESSTFLRTWRSFDHRQLLKIRILSGWLYNWGRGHHLGILLLMTMLDRLIGTLLWTRQRTHLEEEGRCNLQSE